jgi:hypothetical protein
LKLIFINLPFFIREVFISETAKTVEKKIKELISRSGRNNGKTD